LVFDEPHHAALRDVAAATGLDYCGIDCALDHNGDIVVFETNAAMLVHDEKDEIFAYKNPYIAKIKDKFDAMLRRLATGS
jgi:glutathione synthase/RimK-type ligase-like ATP-grasp enzyme